MQLHACCQAKRAGYFVWEEMTSVYHHGQLYSDCINDCLNSADPTFLYWDNKAGEESTLLCKKKVISLQGR